MGKHARIDQLVRDLTADSSSPLHPCYHGYFLCFNSGDYYEAHDVLEHLWLETDGPDHRFYKGLIQFAGAFVHLRKHYENPGHPLFQGRLRPACRLFHLAAGNLAPFTPVHHHLAIPPLLDMADQAAKSITDSGFSHNPWNPHALPVIHPTLDTTSCPPPNG